MKKIFICLLFVMQFTFAVEAQTISTKIEGIENWSFYEGQLITSSAEVGVGQQVKMPHNWGGILTSDIHYGTYITTLTVPSSMEGKRIAFHLPTVSSAYSLYVNGELIEQIGQVASTKELYVAQQREEVIYLVPTTETLEVALQVANYYPVVGGVRQPISISDQESVDYYEKVRNYVQYVFYGGYIVLIVNTLLMYIFGRNETSYLYITLLGVVFVFWNFSLKGGPLSTLFDVSWEVGARIELVMAIVCMFVYIQFFNAMNKSAMNKSVYKLVGVLMLGFIVLGAFLPLEWALYMALLSTAVLGPVIVYMLFLIFKAAYEKRPYARVELIANLIFYTTMLLDILTYQGYLNLPNTSFFGFYAYISIYAARMNREHMKKHLQVNELNEELFHLTTTLDLKIQERTKELYEKNVQLEELMMKDGLTNIYNRRYFNTVLERYFEQAVKTGESLSLLLMDIDYFKKYNDFYGHLGGDVMLKNVAEHCMEFALDQAIVTRYGGEEFAILYQGLSQSEVEKNAQLIRASLVEKQFLHEGREDFPYVTISMGLASFGPDVKSIPQLIEKADEALYESKASGRNCVTVKTYLSEST